jgi:hypothetical protein
MSDPTTGAAEAPPSKKPFYRKPWFWAVAAIAGIMIATSSGGDEGGTPVADSTPATSSTVSAEDEAAAQEARDAYFADTPTPTTEAYTVAEPSAVATTEPAPEPAPVTTEAAPAPEPEPVGDGAELQAMSKALDYLDYTSFSRKGLIDQLVFEGFSTSDATFAVDNTQTDWNQQAAKKAEEYLGYTSFSRSGLVEQLVFEGFTPEQAEYGASQAYPGG